MEEGVSGEEGVCLVPGNDVQHGGGVKTGQDAQDWHLACDNQLDFGSCRVQLWWTIVGPNLGPISTLRTRPLARYESYLNQVTHRVGVLILSRMEAVVLLVLEIGVETV